MAIRITNNNYGGRVSISSRGLGGRFQYVADPVRLLLNDYPGAAAAYSLRKLNNNYVGSAIRVRRSSDNAEQDIGFISGQLNASALLSFCGVGNGFVTTWYDQSGNANNAIQTILARQPQIVLNGTIYTQGTQNAIYFNGHYLTLTNNVSILGDMSYIYVTKKEFLYNGLIIASTLNNTTKIFAQLGDGAFYMSKVNGTTQDTFRGVGGSNNYEILQGFFTSGVPTAFWNNNSLTVPADGSLSNTSTTVNLLGVAASLTNGTEQTRVQEVIIYNSSQLANRTAITNNINSYYSIY